MHLILIIVCIPILYISPTQDLRFYGADGGTGWGSAIGDGVGEIEEN